MSTRKLILTALLCGMAIMLAGGIKLLQVVTTDTAEPALELGVRAKVSGTTVTVVKVEKLASATIVHTVMVGAEGDDGYDGWHVIADGKVTDPLEKFPDGTFAGCTLAGPAPVECTVPFAATKGTVTVVFTRAGVNAQWAS